MIILDVRQRCRLAACWSGSVAPSQRAFTLTELMAVVAIIGVLSVIAVTGFRKVTSSSKVTEARNMIAGISIAQENFRVERGTYANVGDGTFCPSDGLNQVKTAWNPACSGGVNTWALLSLRSGEPVQFGYKTWAGANGPATPPAWVVIPAGVDETRPWFVTHAQADLDPSSTEVTELVGTSFDNQIFERNEGQ